MFVLATVGWPFISELGTDGWGGGGAERTLTVMTAAKRRRRGYEMLSVHLQWENLLL